MNFNFLVLKAIFYWGQKAKSAQNPTGIQMFEARDLLRGGGRGLGGGGWKFELIGA